MGVKLILVSGLALLMTIPSLFVGSLVNERTRRAADVVEEISSHVGGQQTFLGPTLAIPYTLPLQSEADARRHSTYLIFPQRGSAVLKTTTEQRRRSLFRVPVFQAELKFEAKFDLTGMPASLPPGAQLDWSRAEMIVGVSDARGALADATVMVDGSTTTLVPALIAPDLPIGERKLTLFGGKVDDIAKPDAKFNVTSTLHFSGAQRVAVLAYGKTTHLTAQGDWPSPGFDGGFLPVTRAVSNHGFDAEWSVPFIGRGVGADGLAEKMAGLGAASLGISFIEVADPYQSVNRSLKYIPLFLGLVFLTHFVFEVTTGKRVHFAQYILVGIAQFIFYLLLLSFAERIGFDFGFLIAGSATVLLLSFNAGWIFSSRLQGVRAFAIFALLYSLIYLLLRLEDNALLVGAIASFLAVSAAMYFTRTIDWHSSLPATGITEGPDARLPQAGIE
jgi:inner membrane protein